MGGERREGGENGQTKRMKDGPSACSLGDGPLREKTLWGQDAQSQYAERQYTKRKDSKRRHALRATLAKKSRKAGHSQTIL